MHGQLTVEVADLRGWADQIGRAGDDCAYLADHVATFVPDGDFGAVLSLITGEYEHVSRRLGDNVSAAAMRLHDTADAVRHAASTYERVDEVSAAGLGVRPWGHHSPGASWFPDVSSSRPTGPTCAPVQTPSLSFGLPIDAGLGLLARLGGPDIRHEVTELLAGDLDKAMRQAAVWGHAGSAVDGVRANLAHGSVLVSHSWQGVAATAAQSYAGAWEGALSTQRDAMTRLADYLHDVVTEAVAVVQLVCDTVKWIALTLSAGWTLTCVPVFGPIQAARTLKEAIAQVWRARKVLSLFASFLAVVKDELVLLAAGISAEPLPSAPVLSGRAA